MNKKIKYKKCKYCKQEFKQFRSTMVVCSLGCSIDLARDERIAKEKKEWKDMKLRVKSKSKKVLLGEQIRLLSRKIDNYFGYKCIDCGSEYGNIQHAAHLHNSKGNENITYNLHNLHSARAYCNQYSSEHKVGYRSGISNRYGDDYLNYIDFQIKKDYPYLGISDLEVIESLKIVRKINRTFDSFSLESGVQARDMFNSLIGIYKKPYKKFGG